MLDPIPSKLLKEVLPEVIDPLLAIINSSLSLGYVPKNFKLAVIKTDHFNLKASNPNKTFILLNRGASISKVKLREFSI